MNSFDDDALNYENAERMFRKKSKENVEKKFRSTRSNVYKKAMLCSIVVLCVVYFLLPISKVNSISIQGNHYLSDNYIKQKSGLSLNSRMFFSIPMWIESTLKSDPLIEKVSVEWKRDNVIELQIEEKKVIGYRYDDDSPEILFADGSTTELTSDYLDIIAKVPLITGFTEDGLTEKLCSAFQDVATSIIEQMSEISEYSLSYESSVLKILMRTGGYFISDFDNLSAVNYYNDYYSDTTNKDYCIYAVDKTSESSASAYTRVCPWKETKEFWTDENGNVRTKSDGTQIEKHYYTDAEGNDALDMNGNKIVIPIDENGDEIIDGNFQENYANGYYSSGSLVIPEETYEEG